ncbi:hypothetical protein AQUCO_03000366v1 [Aquilegia coerulea]|uniref:Peroxisomal ATPase PEX6 n=1 Tax=Aquilegia coerulea TaxID=218851 RepID=A0A2G5D2S1_AQUCA|nr:hypothetical protein AQUCO_03000366v1 [Aquilegia coerulea]
MVERRKPLILHSTKLFLNSILNSTSIIKNEQDRSTIDVDDSPPLKLPAGILRYSKYHSIDVDDVLHPDQASFDEEALIGVSISVLKKLALTAGSLVIVRNIGTTLQRVGRVIALDRPDSVITDCSNHTELLSLSSPPTMVVFPSYTFPSNQRLPFDEVAFLSPILAFNLDLHISCLQSLVREGRDTIMSLFEVKDTSDDKETKASSLEVEIKPLDSLPKFASHLRASFVKIPECGTIESLRKGVSVETEDRQEMIDLALQDYFEVDRYLARGDIFRVHITWNCNSQLCIPCNRKTTENEMGNVVYFKVIGMEPADEPVLRVNCRKTALVLGGSVPSSVPPDLLVGDLEKFVPVQGNTVKTLGSILTPPLCPSSVSSKFRVAVLLHGLEGCGKRTTVRYVARRLGLHVVQYSCYDLISSSEKKVSGALAQAFETAKRYSPAILLLRHFEVFQKVSSHEGSPSDQVGLTTEVASVLREYTQSDSDIEVSFYGNQPRIIGHQVLLVAVSDSSEGLPAPIRRCFSHELSMGALNEEQRANMLSQLIHSSPEVSKDIGTVDLMKDVAEQTSGFTPRDICALVADAGANSMSRPFPGEIASEPAFPNLSKEDITRALERSKKRIASALGTPKVPNVKWEDVGGLEDVKKAILDTVQLPLRHKALFSSGLRKRSGVLLYGPPGTGKTLLAKAVATECSLNFLSVKGPELINISACPCVIFFDELDSLAPARGASGDSGGVMDRVVSQMLAEIDGLSDTTQDLFIIGASNRPDLIDPALLRPGRFDKLLYVGVNSQISYRERVLKALTRNFKLHENISLHSIATRCPQNFTGADMYALCADAWFHAAKRKVVSLQSDSSGIDDQSDAVIVEFDDFVKVLGELSPSLSVAELKKYELLRNQFEGSTK